MRTCVVTLLATVVCVPLLAQTPRGRRVYGPMPAAAQAATAENAVKQAIEQLGNEKKAYDRDLEVLDHLRSADLALTDPVQPYNAIEKAYDEVERAKSMATDLLVSDGIIKVERQIEDARRSPTVADFGRLRASLRSDAIGPAARLVARNGAKLQDETLAWIRVQELIAAHLRQLAEITSASLRAAQQ